MNSHTATVDEAGIEAVLEALTDENSRRILEALSEPMSAREIEAACDIPLSTTYRKLKSLSETGLVSERIDVSTPGKQTTRYVTDFDTVTVELNDDGSLRVRVDAGDTGGTPLASTGWRRIGQRS
ncbi:winged helix-turn-helix domain-containing protein [Halanaeroarchaeum sulfurireducens]|nr:helix-turn-helix domain-containing protein [Halanaeroarchaeum sulfurireducens]